MSEVLGVGSRYRGPVRYGIGFEYWCHVRNTVKKGRAKSWLSLFLSFDVTTLCVIVGSANSIEIQHVADIQIVAIESPESRLNRR